MVRCAIVSCLMIAVLLVMAVPAADPTPGLEFEATAKVSARQAARVKVAKRLSWFYDLWGS